jgi:hypothetical protein
MRRYWLLSGSGDFVAWVETCDVKYCSVKIKDACICARMACLCIPNVQSFETFLSYYIGSGLSR